MPTASDFDAAAQTLTQTAAEMASWAIGARSRFGTNTLAGGALTLACEQAVDVAEVLATSAAVALRERADLCRHRAAAVRSYEAALSHYRATLHDWRAAIDDLPAGVTPPPSPTRPDKPTFAP